MLALPPLGGLCARIAHEQFRYLLAALCDVAEMGRAIHKLMSGKQRQKVSWQKMPDRDLKTVKGFRVSRRA
jgi:hypothetical protein